MGNENLVGVADGSRFGEIFFEKTESRIGTGKKRKNEKRTEKFGADW